MFQTFSMPAAWAQNRSKKYSFLEVGWKWPVTRQRLGGSGGSKTQRAVASAGGEGRGGGRYAAEARAASLA